MLQVTPQLKIDESYLDLRYARSGGPGGQHVNKVETRVDVHFEFQRCPALSDAHKRRIAEAYPSYVTADGRLVLKGERFRSRERNRADVLERLMEMLRTTRLAPKFRVPTRASRSQKRRRLQDKRRRGDLKKQRRSSHDD